MSKNASSPTSRLLRGSRLFSLPRPLPSPQFDKVPAQGRYRRSDGATLPYPTHQAITTPASSNFRGDWGLKRPLPAKSTRRTNTPVVRVHAQDTYEHITDFSSAADHVLSERKWAQMGVPIWRRATDVRSVYARTQQFSVYESWLDNTSKVAAKSLEGAAESAEDEAVDDPLAKQAIRRRWKTEGPWVAGMQGGEFETWLKKSLLTSQSWRTYAMDEYIKGRVQDAQRRARSEGEFMGEEEVGYLETMLRQTLSYTTVNKRLRDDHEAHGLSSELTRMICDFFDLPRHQAADAAVSNSQDSFADQIDRSVGGGDFDRAPASTHPAAGLSFIRTNAFMENHPIHGAQARRSPFVARVLKPRISSSQGPERQAKLGVGGFVALDTVAVMPDLRSRVAGRAAEEAGKDNAAQLDPDEEGGNRVWVHPDQAFVDEAGRVNLRVLRGEREAVAVKTGNVQAIHEAKFNQKVTTPPTFDRASRAGASGFGLNSAGSSTREAWPGLRIGQNRARN